MAVTNDLLTRRMRAARALAGYSNAEALAEAMDEPGLGASTVRAIEQRKREPAPRDLDVIARACGVSVEFLTGPDDAVRFPVAASPAHDPAATAGDVLLAAVRKDAKRTRDALAAITARLDDFTPAGEFAEATADLVRRVEQQAQFIDRAQAARVEDLRALVTERLDRIEELLHGGEDRRQAIVAFAEEVAGDRPADEPAAPTGDAADVPKLDRRRPRAGGDAPAK